MTERDMYVRHGISVNKKRPEPPRLLIDLRCLQNPDTATRGIGAHARCLIETAPEPFLGLFDPLFPALPEDIAARAERLVSLGDDAGWPDLAPGSVFLNPDPMGKNPLALARLLRNVGIRTAATVYDFIPFDNASIYLDTLKKRLAYATALAWLRQYDVFLPISLTMQTRLAAFFGPVEAHVTGVALPGWMVGVQAQRPRHILMAGGADSRKNPALLARAHAANPVLRQIPLIISGSYTQAQATELRAISDVTLTGAVPPEMLRNLFAQAYCVVTPSFTEGFSLPVIEAMAAGSPAIVSDIPAHRELVADDALRFAPHDAAGLAAILVKIVTNPVLRAAIITAQAPVAAKFSAKQVGERVWQTLL